MLFLQGWSTLNPIPPLQILVLWYQVIKLALPLMKFITIIINTQKLLQQCQSMVIIYFEWLLLGIDREKSGCLLCSAIIALSGVSKTTIMTFSPHFAIRPLLNSFAPSSRSTYDTRHGIIIITRAHTKLQQCNYYKPLYMKHWKVDFNKLLVCIPTVNKYSYINSLQ